MHTVPPTTELFNKCQLVERHPNLLTAARIEWAMRRRDVNGLKGRRLRIPLDQLAGEHDPDLVHRLSMAAKIMSTMLSDRAEIEI
jgi:hypothetical protein